jgi:hypothetical protein
LTGSASVGCGQARRARLCRWAMPSIAWLCPLLSGGSRARTGTRRRRRRPGPCQPGASSAVRTAVSVSENTAPEGEDAHAEPSPDQPDLR